MLGIMMVTDIRILLVSRLMLILDISILRRLWLLRSRLAGR